MNLRPSSASRGDGERGSTILLFLLFLLPAVGITGLVGDIGWYYFTSEAATAAAEAAASAAARSAIDYVTAGGSYSCSSSANGIQCQSATACASASPATISNNVQAGCVYATANGFTNGGLGNRQIVTIEANVTNHPPTIAGVNVLYWVTVRISQSNPPFFAGVYGIKSFEVSVRSTAAVVGKVPPACVVALDPTASSAVSIGGSADLSLNNCALQVNSNSSSAFSMNGSACATASAIDVVGGATSTSCTQPTPTNSANVLPDPFLALAAPSFSTACDHNNYKATSGAAVTLNPGTYCGGITINSATITLNPGTYVLEGGGLSCNAGCNLSGTGVTFYNTCNSGYCNGGNAGYSPINIGGNGSVTLSAPSSGPLAGILFFEDRSVTPQSNQIDSILGGSSATVEGVMYFPKSLVKFAGNFGSTNNSAFLIADQVSFSGNSSLQISPSGPAPAWAPSVALLE